MPDAEAEKHKYYPENWKPLERWLPATVCRRCFAWMWNEEGFECYRSRSSGELLYLDAMGQCWDITEVGAIPADFAAHFERCTGHAYTDDFTTCAQQSSDAEEDDDEDEDRLPLVEPPNGYSLSRILQAWAVEQDVDPVKLAPLLSELRVYNALLLGEQEDQCKTLLKTSQCWLK